MSERRRFRRAELTEAVPVSLHPRHNESDSPEIVGQLKNISLAGLLCQIHSPCELQPGDEVKCHVLIPPPQRRSFPFQRVLGRGTIVRVVPTKASSNSTPASPASSWQLAVAFMPDVTAFGAIEY